MAPHTSYSCIYRLRNAYYHIHNTFTSKTRVNKYKQCRTSVAEALYVRTITLNL